MVDKNVAKKELEYSVSPALCTSLRSYYKRINKYKNTKFYIQSL